MREVEQLKQLARHFGVETVVAYNDGIRQEAKPDSLLAVLNALGVSLTKVGEAPEALRRSRLEWWARPLEPVLVSWQGEAASYPIKLPAGCADEVMDCHLQLETGEELNWFSDLGAAPVLQTSWVEGTDYLIKELNFPPGIPRGYHRLTLAHPRLKAETTIISAPRRLYTRTGGDEDKVWGVFIPLYALHSEQSWGAGDFTDLARLVNWVRQLGGALVGLLPLLASFLDEPFDPSPYAPVSRLFWNEFYLDLTAVPELEQSSEARALLSSPEWQAELSALRKSPTVDYRRLMALKRRVLERLAASLANSPSRRREDFNRWREEHPAALDYARFRATVDQRGTGWPVWPERLQSGLWEPGDYRPEKVDYHLYAQWLVSQQLEQVAMKAGEGGRCLYLDFPLGVHRSGYDTWRERSAFALEASCGAPPDPFMREGQNWGLAPLHPEGIRKQGYRYYIASLRNLFQYAGFLRLDHVMGLHRLFWVPGGLSANDGLYVHYHSEEFYAILSLESHRFQSVVVGEDLGTVPDYVRPAMAGHGLYRLYVLPFELSGDQQPRPSVAEATACLNTHDMRPFAGFWEEMNCRERESLCGCLQRLGWLEKAPADCREGLSACLSYLASGPARILLINLEDLWLERHPQNAPDRRSYPNWRRKAAYSLEQLFSRPAVAGQLRMVSRLRRRSEKGG